MVLAFFLLIGLGANTWLAWVLGAWSGVLSFLVSIPLLAIVMVGGGVAIGLVNILTSKQYHHTYGKRFWRGFIRGWLWLICLIWFLPWGIFGALLATNTWAPATLPRITLSNGEKTVIFQTMMHIASDTFYDDIRADMQRLVGQEYVFFYEGVRPGTEESLERLGTLLGTDVSPEMYDTLARLAGLESQNQAEFAGILPSTNVDLSTDDIVRLAEDQNIANPADISTDLIAMIEERYPRMNATQKYIAYVFSRAVMNTILRVYERPDIVQQLETQVPVFSVILGERNKNIVEAIQASPSRKIYLHYGALHYAGVLSLLQKSDPRWQEISRTEFVVIR